MSQIQHPDSSLMGLIRRYVSASLLLIIATVLALVFANLPATRDLMHGYGNNPFR